MANGHISEQDSLSSDNYFSSLALRTSNSLQTDWLYSSNASDGNTYAPSPLSSPGMPTSSHNTEDLWNASSAFHQGSRPTPWHSSTAVIDWAGAHYQLTGSAYVVPSHISDQQSLDTLADGDYGDDSMADEISQLSSPSTADEGSSSLRVRGAWESQKGLTIGKQSSRVKEKAPVQKSHRRHSAPNSKAHQLRSAKASLKTSSTGSTVTGNGSGPRTNHNDVEKQYRSRLNNQFSSLLNALPQEALGLEYSNDHERQRGISKGEVLLLAKKYICTLEHDKQGLEKERGEREADLESLRKAWVGMGGVRLP